MRLQPARGAQIGEAAKRGAQIGEAANEKAGARSADRSIYSQATQWSRNTSMRKLLAMPLQPHDNANLKPIQPYIHENLPRQQQHATNLDRQASRMSTHAAWAA